MNPAHAGVAALLALAAAFSGMLSSAQEQDPFVTAAVDASASPQDRFQMRSSGWDVGCSVAAGEALEEARRRLLVDPACIDLDPGLTGARWWLERPDGSVAFVRQDGQIVAEFAPGDGAAYESYYPRQPILTLLIED